MINRDLNQDLQGTLVDYFFKAKIILGLTCLFLLLFFYYFRFFGIEARPIIFTLVIELVVWASFFPLRERRPEWVLPYNFGSLWIDVIAITIALHYFGGIYSMVWAAAYLLLIVSSSLFLSKKGRVLFAAYTILAFSLLCHLEHHGVILRHNIFRIPPSTGMDIFFWSSTSLLIFATAILAHKLGELLRRLEKFANLGRLSTELAHEIRTPLQVIEGLLHGVEAPEDVKQEIRVQTERIARFVKEILALGRDERRRVTMLRIHDIVDHSIGQILKAIRDRPGVRVEKDFCEEDLWVEGDADQLVKAFSNLVRNGMDSIDGEGELSVTVSRYGFEWLQVDIRDTGTGMEKFELDRIFEPFYTTKTGRRGIGLGLAIAKKFVEANGGRIDVDSRPGEGSLFTVRLPLAVPPLDASP
jgi:signal transduction histidine kinase